MRISDWSSDVCSSDLPATPVVVFRLAHLGAQATLVQHLAGTGQLVAAQQVIELPRRMGAGAGVGGIALFRLRPAARGGNKAGIAVDVAEIGDYRRQRRLDAAARFLKRTVKDLIGI